MVNLFVSIAALLSGDPSDCPDPANITDESCAGGLASVASIIRHSQQPGNAIFIPTLDRLSKFVQMHPLGWGVNKLISQEHFGWNGYLSPPSLFSNTGRDLTEFRTHNFSPVLTNLDLPPTYPMSQYHSHVYFDYASGTATLNIVDDTQPLTIPALDSLVAALDYVANLNENSGCFQNEGIFGGQKEDYGDVNFNSRCSASTSRCWSTIVYFMEPDEKQYTECLLAALAHPHPPLVFFYAHESYQEQFSPTIVNSSTLVFHQPDSTDYLTHVQLEVGQYDTNKKRSITNMTSSRIDLRNLPLEFMDDSYIKDKQYLRKLSDQALENNPIVGMSGLMPPSRDGNMRKCMSGECPMGNLFTDSLRWASNADCAVISSGGLRGPGWDEGSVSVGDLWTALPFVNYICTGVMSGVSVYRLLNYSTAVATFEQTFTPMGDRLLQMSGMRMSYNTLVDGSGSGRLMSVEIWDNDAQEYLPLERLKLYKFAADNWMCQHFDPYPSLLGRKLEIQGEEPGEVDKHRNVQGIVGEYLTALEETYNTSIQGRLINDAEAFDPLNFIQTPESCLMTQFWEPTLSSCMSCPIGNDVKFSHDLIISDESSDYSGRNLIGNNETFAVTVAPKYSPSWVILRDADELTQIPAVLQPGDLVSISFDIDTSDLNEGSTRSTVTYGVVFDDGVYPGCYLDITFDVLVEVRAEEQLNQIDKIRPVGLSFTALVMLLSISLSLWTYRKRTHRVVKASQPIFLFIICVGVFVMASSIIALSIDDSIASQEVCSAACMAFPWLFSLGFTIAWSSILAKILRLNKVMNGAAVFRRVVVTEREASLPIIVFFLLNLVLLICWSLVDPLEWRREPITENDPTNTYGFCQSEGKATTVFVALLVFFDLVALVLACVQAYHARKMDDEFTESRWLGIACASWIQVLAIGIPVILLTLNISPIAVYFTQTAVVFLCCMSMLLLIFLPKMRLVKKVDTGRTARTQGPGSRGAAPRHAGNRSAVPRGTEGRGCDRSITTHAYQARIRQLEQLLEEAEASKSQLERNVEELKLNSGNDEREDIVEPPIADDCPSPPLKCQLEILAEEKFYSAKSLSEENTEDLKSKAACEECKVIEKSATVEDGAFKNVSSLDTTVTWDPTACAHGSGLESI
eukprot:CAMPEP_0172535426 /NCGR_PEP_ID=MMETSP1067-20121228/7438_1 /TAXON_ID=265564 ORGANISM="Thalassiosira punctigera, Strain Tpunct2005C2" /NCGR_SAMPLE_ID=MMETSP1067 /ASSEMBLY_ACC=CAM_ASM_000444 /LENGTH=1140 /DNA_ID=CAMNT_0013320359 /DNA_START=87 /DNA_END=3509 /DNA_ORIENTATION=+